MERPENREKYLKDFAWFFKMVKLTKSLEEGLKHHKLVFFREQMQIVHDLGNEELKKQYILLEFTRLRSTCQEMVHLLRSVDQKEAAYVLEMYNTSPGRMKITTKVEIEVTQVKAPFIGSSIYSMTKNSRGKCIIINNIPKLFKESQRFEYIFKELFFDVETKFFMTAQQISDKLKSVAEDKNLTEHEALLVMVISHGKDEKVLGYNACRKLEDELFDESDVIKISEIVDTFAEKKCMALRQTPKMFFFNCCRIKSYDALKPTANVMLLPFEAKWTEEIPENNEIEIFLRPHGDRVFIKLNTIDQKWVNENKDTFISYSCSEGFRSFFYPYIGISVFGQALSHSIAQYACEESLNGIMSRTCDLMDDFKDDFIDDSMDEYEWMSENRPLPEMRAQYLRRQLFFNPGFHK